MENALFFLQKNGSIQSNSNKWISKSYQACKMKFQYFYFKALVLSLNSRSLWIYFSKRSDKFISKKSFDVINQVLEKYL